MNLQKLLDGKKTYIAAVGLAGLAVFRATSGDIPGAIQDGLAALAAFGVRSAISKNVKLGDEIGQELGKQIVRRRKKLAILAPLFIAFTTISCAQKVDGQCAIECTSACAARCTNECSKAMAENEVN